MVACCKCNRSGQCRGCACVKAGKHCSNCLPSRLGNCSNLSPTTKGKDLPSVTDNTPDHHASPSISSNVVKHPTPTSAPCDNDGVTSPTRPNQQSPGPVLPPYEPMAEPNFVWGNTDSLTFCKLTAEVYEEIIHWKKNCFKIPLGNSGKSFVLELARLYNAFATGSTLECVALKATIVLPILLL